MPLDDTREPVSLNECGAEPSANSFLPPPRTTGTLKMLIASTRSLASSACKFLADLLIEIGHHPAAELEPLGRILARAAGRLHDAVYGNLGADDDFSHVSSLCVDLG